MNHDSYRGLIPIFKSDPRSGSQMRRGVSERRCGTAASNCAPLFSSSVPRPTGIGLKIFVEISLFHKSEIYSNRDDKLRICIRSISGRSCAFAIRIIKKAGEREIGSTDIRSNLRHVEGIPEAVSNPTS
jgi:hypothetical protein